MNQDLRYRDSDISNIRKLLETAFGAEELRQLFALAEEPKLHPVALEFAPDDGLPAGTLVSGASTPERGVSRRAVWKLTPGLV